MNSPNYRVLYPVNYDENGNVEQYMDMAILGLTIEEARKIPGEFGHSVPELICRNDNTSMLARINCKYFGGFQKASIEYKCPYCGSIKYLPPQPLLSTDEYWRRTE